MMEVRRALLLSSGERYITLSVNFATVAAVSRILTPAEIGISVVGMAVVGIAITLREFASASFIIQRHDLRPEDVRGAFTVSLALTSGIVLFLIASGPYIADAFGEETLSAFFLVICVCLFGELVWSQIVTLLRRELAFGKVAAINLSSAATSALVTVGLALNGVGYMSFAWGWLAAASAAGLLAISLRPDLSVFVPTLSNWRGMVAFGGYNGVTVLLYKLFEQIPYIVLGRVVSADAAALFNRSVMITQLPDKVALGGAIAVVLPAFAAAARQGRCLRDLYLRALAWVTGLLWPAHLVLAILAFPVVDLLLGYQWHAAAPMVRIIAIGSLFAFSFELNYPVLVAVGAIRDVFLRAVIVFPAATMTVSLAAIFGGLHAATWSLVAILPLNAWVGLHFVRRRLGLTWWDLAGAVRPSAVLGLVTAAGPLTLVLVVGSFELDLAQGVLGAALAGVGWLAGIRFTGHPLAAELAGFARACPRPWARPALVARAEP